MLALLDNEMGFLSAPLIGDFVEAGIDIVHGIALSFGARNDESHLGYFFVGCGLASDTDKGQGYQPTIGNGFAAIVSLKYTAGE